MIQARDPRKSSQGGQQSLRLGYYEQGHDVHAISN